MSPRKNADPLPADRLVDVRQALVEFKGAQETLASTNTGLPALNETEIVSRVLALAHGDAAVEEMHDALGYSLGIFSHDIPDRHELSKPQIRRFLRNQPDVKNRILRDWESVSAERHWFKTALITITDRKRAAINALRLELPVRPTGVFVISQLDWTFSTLEQTDKIACLTVQGICFYVIMLLLDSNRDLGGALRRCKLESCSRFFLSFPSAAGGPSPSYCEPEHRTLAAKLTGPERTARWRAKRATKKRGKK